MALGLAQQGSKSRTGRLKRSRGRDLRGVSGGRMWVEGLESRKLLSGSAIGAAAEAVVQTGFGKYEPLDWLYQEYLAQGAQVGFASNNPLLQVADGRIAVDLSVADWGVDLQRQLESLGMEITSGVESRVSGWIPISSLGELSSVEGVSAATPTYRALTSVGSVTTQGDAVMRSDDIRRYLGPAGADYQYDGTGVMVGVLSDSFDVGPGSYAADIASGDLPTGVQVLADAPSGTDEGRAMMQLIHDVAPGANLMFATTYGGERAFAQNILALADAGADVIVDDVLYLNEPMFMDGVIAQAVDTVKERGIPYFSSAGNLSRASYQPVSGFVSSGQYGSLGGSAGYQELLHNFAPAGAPVDPYQQMTVPVGTGMIITFQWAEVFRSLLPESSGAASDMDIFLYASGDPVEPISGSARFSKGADPVEIFSFYNDGSYDGNHDGVADTTFQLAIGQWGTTGTPALKYVMYQYGDRSKGMVTIDEYATNSGTCYGHANAAGAMTVAAAFYEQSSEYRDDPPVVEPFSSAGGTPILLDRQGNRIGAKTRSKPDITGPDGTSTTFFGSQTEDDRTGEQSRPSFFGTSAAAPHVAGVAALMLQARPSATADEIYDAMKSTAANMGAPGWDNESGYGLIRAADALLSLSGAQKVTVDAGTYANNGGVDTFRIVRSGSRLRFYINNTLGFDAETSSVQSIVVNGSNDADELIVDFSGGYIAPPISFNGGGGFNVLSEEGGSLTSTTHTPTGANSGMVDSDGMVVSYQGVNTLNDLSTAGEVILNGTEGIDHIAVGNGPVVKGFQTTEFSSQNGTFGIVNVANKRKLTIHAGNGSDAIILSSTVRGAGLNELFLDTNAGEADTVHVMSTPAGVTTTLTNAGGSDAVTVGYFGNVQQILGELGVQGSSGMTRLDVDDSADGSAREVSVAAGSIVGLAPVAIGFVPGSLSGLTIRGGAGGNTLSLAAGYREVLRAVELIGGAGADLVTVNLAEGAEVVSVRIVGQEGADTVNVSTLAHAVVSVDGGAQGDRLNINGAGGNWNLTGTDVLAGSSPRVTYSGIETIGLENGTFVGAKTIAAEVVVGAATLAGGASIGGAVSVGSGGTVAPGPGVISTQQMNLGSGSTLAVDLQGPVAGKGYDQVSVVGTVGLANVSLAIASVGAIAEGDVFVIIRNDGSDPVVGNFAQGGTIQVGPEKFTINYAYDGDGDGNKNDVALTYVGSTNAAPVAGDDEIEAREDQSLTILTRMLLGNDSDADGDTLTIIEVSGMDAAMGTVELRDGDVVFTPVPHVYGTTSFQYTVSDGHRGTAVATVNVRVLPVNDSPVLEAIASPIQVNEGEAVSFQAKASDEEGGQLSYSLVNAPVGARIDAGTGLFTWTPGYEAAGEYALTVRVADNGSPSAAATQDVVIVVRDVPLTMPIVAPDGGQEGSVLQASFGGVMQSGMSFEWSVRKDGVAYALPAGTVTNLQTFSFVPEKEGSYELKLMVTQPDGSRAAGSKTVAVANVPAVVKAGSDETVGAGSLFTRSGTFSDPGADRWAATVDYGDGTGELPLTLSGKGFTLSHTYRQAGGYRVVVTVNDGTVSRSGSFVVTVVETSYRVVSVTPTASGFDLVFNRAIDTRKLNLYDGMDWAADLADMTVVGQTSGTLNGSLILDATQNNTLHWVQSGGVLAADTYTVTLFSRADGFVDATGELLDGDSSGEAGGDYRGTVTVTRGDERIVSLPDMVRGPSQTMSLPIRIDNGAGVQRVDLELVYDEKLLQVDELTLAAGMPAGWEVTSNMSTPGRVVVSLTGITPLSAGAKDLVSVKASVPATVAYGASQVLRLTNIELNNSQAISVVGDSAVHVAAYLGDATGNRKYSGMDASYIAGVTIRLTSGFDAYPRIDPVLIGDTTGNGKLSGMDAAYVAQKSVGLPVSQIPDLPGTVLSGGTVAAAAGGQVVLNRMPSGSQLAAVQEQSNRETSSIAPLRDAKRLGEQVVFSSKRIGYQEPVGATLMEVLRRRGPKVEAARAGLPWDSARSKWV